MHIEINPVIRNVLKEVFMYDGECNLLHIHNELVPRRKLLSNIQYYKSIAE